MGETAIDGNDPVKTGAGPGFVHLRLHSAYSLLKGSIKIAKLGELAGSGAAGTMSVLSSEATRAADEIMRAAGSVVISVNHIQ